MVEVFDKRDLVLNEMHESKFIYLGRQKNHEKAVATANFKNQIKHR